jgi:hypothetical protein
MDAGWLLARSIHTQKSTDCWVQNKSVMPVINNTPHNTAPNCEIFHTYSEAFFIIFWALRKNVKWRGAFYVN